MTPSVVALTGLSGVGKSTLLGRLNDAFPMQVLQASALIKDARESFDQEPMSLDTLRSLDLDENQRLLVQGFQRRVDQSASLIVLDCHTVIETPQQLILIDPRVFGAIKIAAIVFLEDDPADIVSRRRIDNTRRRPDTTAAELYDVQRVARRHTNAIAIDLDVPLYVHHPEQDDLIAKTLRSHQRGDQ